MIFFFWNFFSRFCIKFVQFCGIGWFFFFFCFTNIVALCRLGSKYIALVRCSCLSSPRDGALIQEGVDCVIGAILIVGFGNFVCIYVIVLCLFCLMLAMVYADTIFF